MEKNIQEFTITSKNREEIGFTNNTKELVIPEFFVGDGKNDTIKGQTYQVTEIGFEAFGDCVNLQKVVMPDSIVKIYPYAFANDVHLEDIHFSQNLEEIGEDAFSNDRNLKKVKLPHKIRKIRSGAFIHARNLQEVDTGEAKKLQHIGSCAFAECVSLKKFDLPVGLRQMPISVFQGCSSLERVDSQNKIFESILNGKMIVHHTTKRILWVSPKATRIFISREITKISPPRGFSDCQDLSQIIIDQPKDSISGAPWGAKNAHVYWIG